MTERCLISMKNKKWILFLYLLLNLLWLAFIFGHSLESIAESKENSLEVGGILNAFLEVLSIPIALSDHVVRKTAHFVEFFLLGTLYFGWIPLLEKNIRRSAVYVLFGGLMTAVCDEYLQYFSERGSLVTDVVLDFSAVVASFLFWSAVLTLLRRRRKNAQRKEK